MKRRLFNAGALVSLLWLAVVAVLWIRSYWIYDYWVWSWGKSEYQLSSARGGLWGERAAPWVDRGWESYPVEFLDWLSAKDSAWRLLWQFDFGGPSEFKVPHWACALAFGVLPIAWAFLAKRRPWPGRCPACGYDLRGTPGSECPECGAAPGKREDKA